jgi:phage/plasmid-associated DNA primase
MRQKATETDENKIKFLGIKIDRASEIASRLESNTNKKKIMSEALELFFDEQFFQKIDTDPYLLCCANGVVDFKNKTFRQGKPDDYISMTTKIQYVKVNPEKHSDIIRQIEQFMHELFPIRFSYFITPLYSQREQLDQLLVARTLRDYRGYLLVGFECSAFFLQIP